MFMIPENAKIIDDDMIESTAEPENELEKLRELVVNYEDQYLRSRAEFHNYQKRIKQDREQESKYGHAVMAFNLLPVLDNLKRAVAASKEDDAINQGIKMVLSQFTDTLKKHGVVQIEAEGKPFNAVFHQAIMQQSSDTEPNTVIRVMEEGFMIHDRLLRPAKVIVSKKEKE